MPPRTGHPGVGCCLARPTRRRCDRAITTSGQNARSQRAHNHLFRGLVPVLRPCPGTPRHDTATASISGGWRRAAASAIWRRDGGRTEDQNAGRRQRSADGGADHDRSGSPPGHRRRSGRRRQGRPAQGQSPDRRHRAGPDRSDHAADPAGDRPGPASGARRSAAGDHHHRDLSRRGDRPDADAARLARGRALSRRRPAGTRPAATAQPHHGDRLPVAGVVGLRASGP